MSNTSNLKKHLAPLLERHGDIVLQGRWMILKPVKHYARGVYFDRSRGRGSLIPIPMIGPLYEDINIHHTGHFKELRRKDRAWDTRDPASQSELLAILENVVVPLLRSVEAPEQFLSIACKKIDLLADWHEAMCFITLGEWTTAELKVHKFKASWSLSTTHSLTPNLWAQHTVEHAQFVLDLLRTDRPQLIRQLHAWEAETARLWKVEKYWSPSPFPCELV